MIKLAIIGTRAVSRDFIQAARMSGKYEITAIYSRKEDTAVSFAKEMNIPYCFYDEEKFFKSKVFDTVYICTPNAIHYDFAIKALKSNKNIIVEKPAFASVKQWEEVHNLAKEKKLFVFEASRNIYEDNFNIVRKWVQNKKIDGAVLTFTKYSSKYDDYLKGKVASSLSGELSGGALMDLGVYLVYAAISWFGIPEDVNYNARKIDTGVDISGTAILSYTDFDVILHTAKNIYSYLPSEIYAGKETLIIDNISITQNIEINYDNKKTEKISLNSPEHYMLDEAREIADVIENKEDKNMLEKYEYWKNLSYNVIKVIEKLKKTADIKI